MVKLPPWLVRLLHPLVHAAHRAMAAIWFATRPATTGVHAIPIDEQGRLILVRLSYAKGWRLPGGGVGAGEDRTAAVLRELREEIGMTAHGRVAAIGDFEHRPDFRRDSATLFLVEGVHHRFRPSLEVAEARAFPRHALPADLPPVTRRLLALWSAGPPID